jgi:hypothetical protein
MARRQLGKHLRRHDETKRRSDTDVALLRINYVFFSVLRRCFFCGEFAFCFSGL